ncbi:MAG: glycosyltransferase family 2 protein [Bdellovibrionota bacterium]
MNTSKVFVHIVLYNSMAQHGAVALKKNITALLEQEGFTNGENLKIVVRDNGSKDGAAEFLKEEFKDKVVIESLKENLGFAGGQNLGVRDFLESDFDHILILNPDIKLEKSALKYLSVALEEDPTIGMVCPKLFRGDAELNPVYPLRLDAAGMILTETLRHFDRGSEREDCEKYSKSEDVFGGSGACLLLKRSCVEDLLVEAGDITAPDKIFPQLAAGRAERAPLFDEAFFAYREDADLAWRAQLFGWRCLYVAIAKATHRRVVLPERRQVLPAELNKHSVRNRFLLQLNNYSLRQSISAFFCGVLWRNLLVLVGVILKERTSLPALKEVWILKERALARRKVILEKAKQRNGIKLMRQWFYKR